MYAVLAQECLLLLSLSPVLRQSLRDSDHYGYAALRRICLTGSPFLWKGPMACSPCSHHSHVTSIPIGRLRQFRLSLSRGLMLPGDSRPICLISTSGRSCDLMIERTKTQSATSKLDWQRIWLSPDHLDPRIWIRQEINVNMNAIVSNRGNAMMLEELTQAASRRNICQRKRSRKQDYFWRQARKFFQQSLLVVLNRILKCSLVLLIISITRKVNKEVIKTKLRCTLNVCADRYEFKVLSKKIMDYF